MKAVLVGAGASGSLHALALRAAGVSIAAIYDPDRDRARALAEACDARTVDSLESAAQVDAAFAAVCSPPNVHGVQAEALATGGRIVFVEKPVATTRADLERLARLPGCVPVLQWRAGRALRALRRAIRAGELGRQPTVTCDLAWGRDADYFAARRSWGCGALVSIGIHALDAIAWALGRSVERVAGSRTRARPEHDGETAAAAILGFAGGAIAALRISLDGGADSTWIRVCGGGATAELVGTEGDPTGGALRWSSATKARTASLEALERTTPGALGSPLLVPYLGDAISAVRDGQRPGDSAALLSIADVFGVHATAFELSNQT